MKGKENSALTSRQMDVLPYILSTSSYEEAARQSGITAKQIHMWLKQPEFQEELKKQRNNIFYESLTALKAGTQKAVQTLLLLLNDEDPRVRLSAAEKVLSNAFRSVELYEIETRMNEIEVRVEDALKKQEAEEKTNE